jgi:EAL domain-containing protein (putative c-di-GMP-specific phosphodiesterase class I)/ActR/RegA family two-component response regulator
VISRIGVLVADDDPSVRAALADLVASHPALELLGCAADAADATDLARRLRPDVALVDAKMPGGGAFATRSIRECSPQTRVVVLSAHDEPNVVLEMLQAGAASYVLKGARGDEVVAAVIGAARGESILSPAITGCVVEELSSQLDERAREHRDRVEVEERVRKMLAQGSYQLVYQRVVDLASGRVVGVEALTRFLSEPARAPSDWFEEAGRVGLRADLELAVAKEALSSIGRLPKGCFLALNFSPRVLPLTTEMLSFEAGERIVIEITEHEAIEDYGELKNTVAELRALGARVAVDDAGAGFASLHHTLQIAPDLIKLDVSLTRGIDADASRRELATALIGFARGVDAAIVAEGIETEGQLDALRELGVSFGQGFHIAPPLRLEAQPELLAA